MLSDDFIGNIVEKLEEKIRNRLESVDIDLTELRRDLEQRESALAEAQAAKAAEQDPIPPLFQSLAAIEKGTSRRDIVANLVIEIGKRTGGCAVVLLGDPESTIWPGPGMGLGENEEFGDRKVKLRIPEGSLISRAAGEGKLIAVPFSGSAGDVAVHEALEISPPEYMTAIPMAVNGRVQAVVMTGCDGEPGPPEHPEALAILVHFAGMVLDLSPLRGKVGLLPLPQTSMESEAAEPAIEIEEVEPAFEAEVEAEAAEPAVEEEAAQVEAPEAETEVAAEPAIEIEEEEPVVEAEPEEAAEPAVEEEEAQVEAPEAETEVAAEPAIEIEEAEPVVEAEAGETEEPAAVVEEEEKAEGAEEVRAEEAEEAVELSLPAMELEGYDLSGMSEEERPQHEKAIRFARLLVSEIKLYNEETVRQGRENADLASRLKDDIERSRALYTERISEEVRENTDYFQEEMIRQLAEGDPAKMGGG